MVLNDPTRAGRLGRGLRACWPAAAATAPTPSRSTPATTAASAGSRSSTSAAAGIVGGEDYGAGARTRTGATCSPRIKKACPNLSNETVRPTRLAAGRRTLKVRVTDAAGNVTEQGPYVVDVVTPSDRGPLNGSGATDGGTLTAHFSGKRKRHKTVGYRKRVRVSGRLLNSAGKPISGALLKVLTRDRRSGAHFVQRWATTTNVRRPLQASRSAPAPRGWSRSPGPRTPATPARRRAPT